MISSRTPALRRSDASVAFYEDRYKTGYMDDWSALRKRQVLDILRSVELPSTGRALDFGCGQGIFTEVLAQRLPGWEICGTDISEAAIALARRRFPEHEFFTPSAWTAEQGSFDLVFTHHVLEHASDLGRATQAIASLLRPRAAMVHVLTCGNEGSLVHRLATLTVGGMDHTLEDRFYFEDEGTLRRLTTEQLEDAFKMAAFSLVGELYGDQWDGAVDWISNYGVRFAWEIADPKKAHDERSRKELRRLRWRFGLLALTRFPADRVRLLLRKPTLGPWGAVKLCCFVPLWPFSRPVDAWVRHKTEQEWAHRRHDRRGGDMYLAFVRHGGHDAVGD